MVETDKPKRKGRGPGKKPALLYVGVRLPQEVLEYLNTFHAANRQAKIREILTEYVTNQGATKDGAQKND